MTESNLPNNRRDFLTGKLLQSQVQSQMAVENVLGSAEKVSKVGDLLQHFSRRAMACDFQIFLEFDAPGNVGKLALLALDEVERIENLLSVYRFESEVSRVNRETQNGSVVIDEELLELVTIAISLHTETHGAYDLTATQLSRLWGFFGRKPMVPTDDEIAAVLTRVGSQYVNMNKTAQTLRFERPGMEIDFNSIGKGYALDAAVTKLISGGLDRFIIHGGQSSVVARLGDERDGLPLEPWRVSLTHPLFSGQSLGLISIGNESLATSGSARQAFYHQGKRLGHILDPRTGWPAAIYLSVSVLHPRATMSDALATAFFVMPWEEVEAYCEQHRETQVIAVIEESSSQRPTILTCNLPAGKFEATV